MSADSEANYLGIFETNLFSFLPIKNYGIVAGDKTPLGLTPGAKYDQMKKFHDDKAYKSLRSWTGRLQGYVEESQQQRDAKPDVDPKDVATLIVASLEGALMMSRIQRNEEPLRCVQSHLNEYLNKGPAIFE